MVEEGSAQGEGEVWVGPHVNREKCKRIAVGMAVSKMRCRAVGWGLMAGGVAWHRDASMLSLRSHVACHTSTRHTPCY